MLELTIIAGSSPDNPSEKCKQFDDRGGVIGRDVHSAWMLFDSSRIISNQHAKVIFSQGTYYLSDLSINGISTLQGQKLRKGEYRPLKLGDVYIIGPYHIEVTRLDTEDKTELFKEAGLAHLLEESKSEEVLSPFQYVAKEQKPFADFPLNAQAETLKAFDFMPEPIDFNQGSFIAKFCQLFNLNSRDFEGIPDASFQKSITALMYALSKKMGEMTHENTQMDLNGDKLNFERLRQL